MKRCPSCNRTYTDPSLNFCLEDGAPLVVDAAPASNPSGGYPTSRDRAPLPTQAFQPQHTPLLNQVEPSAQPRQWTPMGTPAPRKKSNAIWWILGGVLVAGVIVVGATIMILALASMGDSNDNTNTNANTNRNSNTRTVNRNSNANSSVANTNSNANLASSFEDDFSEAKWGAGTYDYGDIWYEGDEYHMRAKAKSFLVMYAPSNDYNTENATVRVTTRSVDGNGPSTGYGLIVHGQKKGGDLEDYALLIYTGADPQYEIVKHKGGAQTTVVPWTKSKILRSGSNPNQLEIRAKGSELTFYINGQYVDRITDTENFRRGLAGLYTSDTADVAFDDLEIER